MAILWKSESSQRGGRVSIASQIPSSQDSKASSAPRPSSSGRNAARRSRAGDAASTTAGRVCWAGGAGEMIVDKAPQYSAGLRDASSRLGGASDSQPRGGSPRTGTLAISGQWDPTTSLLYYYEERYIIMRNGPTVRIPAIRRTPRSTKPLTTARRPG